MESLFQTEIIGTVSETERLSKSKASQSIFATAQMADFFISIKPLYVEIQPHLESDFESILELVFFHICITFDPIS
jgi:hypothetical protein